MNVMDLLKEVGPENIIEPRDRQVILDLINWVLMDIEGTDYMDYDEELEMRKFERKVRNTARRLGFKRTDGGRMK